MFTKLGRDEMPIAPHMHEGVSAISAQGRIQGGKKITGVPFLKETGRLQQQTRMHSNDLEVCRKKCRYIWFHFEVKFFTRFLPLFEFSHFALF